MSIVLSNIGKRFKREWIFKKIDFEFSAENTYAILGSNGSGKSTLLQLIAGSISPSEGSVSYHQPEGTLLESELAFRQLSYAAPYMELIEEYTLKESIEFHQEFKPFINNLSVKEIIDLIQLKKASDKQLKYFSSGMKQRVRLALAILSDTPILLLDEPCSNFDQKSIEWYKGLISQYGKTRLVIVCSNHLQHEYSFCTQELLVENYK